MNVITEQLSRAGFRGRVTDLAFCVVWIGLAIIYVCLAMDAHTSLGAKVPRSGFRIPPSQNVQIGNLRFAEVINSLAEKYDQTASVVEQSIRRSARSTFCLNLTGVFLSIVGFAAQWTSGNRRSRQLDRLENTQPLFSESEEIAPTVRIHDGSFPDAGYGR